MVYGHSFLNEWHYLFDRREVSSHEVCYGTNKNISMCVGAATSCLDLAKFRTTTRATSVTPAVKLILRSDVDLI